MQVDDGSDGEGSDAEEPSIVENSSLVSLKRLISRSDESGVRPCFLTLVFTK